MSELVRTPSVPGHLAFTGMELLIVHAQNLASVAYQTGSWQLLTGTADAEEGTATVLQDTNMKGSATSLPNPTFCNWNSEGFSLPVLFPVNNRAFV